MLTRLFLVLIATVMVSGRHFRALESIKGLYPDPEDFGRNHRRSFHHHDNVTNDFVKLDYEVEHKEGYTFARIKQHAAFLYCRNTNSELRVGYNTPEEAQAFFNEVSNATIVTSHPPVLCHDGNTIMLRVQQVEMMSPTEVYVRGGGVHIMEVFESIKVEFHTNLLPGDSVGRTPHAVHATNTHPGRTLLQVAPAFGDAAALKPVVIPPLEADVPLFMRRVSEHANQGVDANNAFADKDRDKNLNLNVTNNSPRQIGVNKVVLGQKMQEQGTGKETTFTGGGDWAYMTASPWIKLNLDAGTIWEWGGSKSIAVDQSFGDFFDVGATFAFDAYVGLKPNFHFKMDYNTGKLQIFECWLDVFYEYMFRPTLTINKVLKKGWSKSLVSLSFPGVVIPVGFIPISICPGFELNFKVDMSVERTPLAFKTRTNSVGSMRMGIKYDAKATERLGTKDVSPFTVPIGYRPKLGSECVTGRWTNIATSYEKLESCAAKCAALPACTHFAWDTYWKKCDLGSACTDWALQSAKVFYFVKDPTEKPKLAVDTVTTATLVVYLEAALSVSVTLGVCELGFGLGGLSITLNFGHEMIGKYTVSAPVAPAKIGTVATMNIKTGFYVTLAVGLSIDISIKVWVFKVSLYSLNLVTWTLFTIKVPQYEITEIMENVAPYKLLCPSIIKSFGDTEFADWNKLERVGKKDVEEPPTPGAVCPPVDAALNAVPVVQPPAAKKAGGRRQNEPVVKPVWPPVIGTVWTGVCDAEVYIYETSIQHVSDGLFNLGLTITTGDSSGTNRVRDKECEVRGLYRLIDTSNRAVGKILTLQHRRDPTFDVERCWFQPLPSLIQFQLTEAGAHHGIWLYMNTTSCADMHLRVGSEQDLLKEGFTMIVEQTMLSQRAQLVLQRDGNVVINNFDTDRIHWESNTRIPLSPSGSFGQIEVSLTLLAGVVAIETRYTGSSTLYARTVLNGAGDVRGQYLVLNDCDLSLYDSISYTTSLWNLTNRPCADATGTLAIPKYHRGGPFLRLGEILRGNNGLYNDNGYLEHENGHIYFVKWIDLSEAWSTNTRAVSIVKETVAFSLLWSGNLVLTDYAGKTVWESNTAGMGATTARLEKCGFALYKQAPNIGKVWGITGPNCPDVRDAPKKKSNPWTSFPLPPNRMEPGSFIIPGESVLSANAQLIHLPDGNVVLYTRDNTTIPRALWSSKTAGTCSSAFAFEFDGNLTQYACPGMPPVLWSAGPSTVVPKMVLLNDDCTLQMIYRTVHGNSFTNEGVVKTISDVTCAGISSEYTDMSDASWIELYYPLKRGQAVMTPDSAILHQPDGDVVFFAKRPNRILWRTNTAGRCTSDLAVEGGNVVLKDCQGIVIWQLFAANAVPGGGTGYYLTIKDYFMILETFDEIEIWNSKSSQIMLISASASASGSVAACPAEATGGKTFDEKTLIGVAIGCIVGTAFVICVGYFLKQALCPSRTPTDPTQAQKDEGLPRKLSASNPWSGYPAPSDPQPGHGAAANPIGHTF